MNASGRKCITLSVQVTFCRLEADGSDCEACGDAIYLDGSCVVVTVGKDSGVVAKLCQSCGDLLKSVDESEVV